MLSRPRFGEGWVKSGWTQRTRRERHWSKISARYVYGTRNTLCSTPSDGYLTRNPPLSCLPSQSALPQRVPWQHVILEHRARAQRVLHPRAHLASPRRARLAPAPLHALHQRTRTVALATRLRALRALLLRQRWMSFGTALPARHRHRHDRDHYNRRGCPHRVFIGILPEGSCRAIPQ